MNATITVRAKGYQPRKITLAYVRHLGTVTSHHAGDGTPNIDRDLYRVVETGAEVEISTPANDATMFPSSLRVMPAMAHLYGMTARQAP